MTALLSALAANRRWLAWLPRRPDRLLLALLAIFLLLALLDPGQIAPSLAYIGKSAWHLLPYFLLAVALSAYVEISGADHLIARAFSSHKYRSILLAAALGALAPFCSCGVIPLVVALLAAGVPLSPVMAFLIASPLMDPSLFALSTGVIGLEFTVARLLVALVGGLLAGLLVAQVDHLPAFQDLVRAGAKPSCCQRKQTLSGKAVHWAVWQQRDSRQQFLSAFGDRAWFLGRWMLLAYALSSLMIAYTPADLVQNSLGSGRWWTIPLAVLIGLPLYVNGAAATTLVAELMRLGMSGGAAMAFLTAGAVACLPSFTALLPMLKRSAMLLYLAMGLLVSLLAGLATQVFLAITGAG